MVERSLSMREVMGSIPISSKSLFSWFYCSLFSCLFFVCYQRCSNNPLPPRCFFWRRRRRRGKMSPLSEQVMNVVPVIIAMVMLTVEPCGAIVGRWDHNTDDRIVLITDFSFEKGGQWHMEVDPSFKVASLHLGPSSHVVFGSSLMVHDGGALQGVALELLICTLDDWDDHFSWDGGSDRDALKACGKLAKNRTKCDHIPFRGFLNITRSVHKKDIYVWGLLNCNTNQTKFSRDVLIIHSPTSKFRVVNSNILPMGWGIAYMIVLLRVDKSWWGTPGLGRAATALHVCSSYPCLLPPSDILAHQHCPKPNGTSSANSNIVLLGVLFHLLQPLDVFFGRVRGATGSICTCPSGRSSNSSWSALTLASGRTFLQTEPPLGPQWLPIVSTTPFGLSISSQHCWLSLWGGEFQEKEYPGWRPSSLLFPL